MKTTSKEGVGRSLPGPRQEGAGRRREGGGRRQEAETLKTQCLVHIAYKGTIWSTFQKFASTCGEQEMRRHMEFQAP